ncbi:MAG: hypothetical protein H6836_09270 [Planctomycetes bacterium]|nr:hypothetical protein [Planctomycetota bacterium]
MRILNTLGALLVATVSGGAQESIRWEKTERGDLPAAAVGDARPTILYFTFDT